MKILKTKIATIIAALAVVVVLGMVLTACDNTSSGMNNNQENPINQLQGLYVSEYNSIFYFTGNDYYFSQISLSEENEDGIRIVKFTRFYDYNYNRNEGKIRWIHTEKYSVIERAMNPKKNGQTTASFLLIDCTLDENRDLTMGFTTPKYGIHKVDSYNHIDPKDLETYECGTYHKISNIVDYIKERYPDVSGYKIDFEDVSGAFGIWSDLLLQGGTEEN